MHGGAKGLGTGRKAEDCVGRAAIRKCGRNLPEVRAEASPFSHVEGTDAGRGPSGVGRQAASGVPGPVNGGSPGSAGAGGQKGVDARAPKKTLGRALNAGEKGELVKRWMDEGPSVG